MTGATQDRTRAIRVAIVELDGLLGAVVRSTLAEEHDMEVVQLGSVGEIAPTLRHGVDVVVTSSATGDLPASFRPLLFSTTPVPVAVISADGTRIDVYGHTITYGGGLDRLTGLIRDAVAVTRTPEGGG